MLKTFRYILLSIGAWCLHQYIMMLYIAAYNIILCESDVHNKYSFGGTGGAC